MTDTLNMNENLVHGQQYTFSFLSGVGIAAQVGGVIADGPTLTAQFQADLSGFMSGITVKVASDLEQQFLSDTQVDVTFIYTQAGADTVSSLSDLLMASLYQGESFYSSVLTNYPSFVGAYGGSQGAVKNGLGIPSLPSTSSLWAIAVLALLGVFVFSGGASATRAALA